MRVVSMHCEQHSTFVHCTGFFFYARAGAPTLSKHRNRSSTGGFVPAAPSARGAYATCEDQATTTVSEENGEQGHKALLGVLESLIHPETRECA